LWATAASQMFGSPSESSSVSMVTQKCAKLLAMSCSLRLGAFQSLADLETACFDLGIEQEAATDVAARLWAGLAFDGCLHSSLLLNALSERASEHQRADASSAGMHGDGGGENFQNSVGLHVDGTAAESKAAVACESSWPVLVAQPPPASIAEREAGTAAAVVAEVEGAAQQSMGSLLWMVPEDSEVLVAQETKRSICFESVGELSVACGGSCRMELSQMQSLQSALGFGGFDLIEDDSKAQTLCAVSSVPSHISLETVGSQLLPGATDKDWHLQRASTFELTAESSCSSVPHLPSAVLQKATRIDWNRQHHSASFSAGPTFECVDCKDLSTSSFDGIADVVEGEMARTFQMWKSG